MTGAGVKLRPSPPPTATTAGWVMASEKRRAIVAYVATEGVTSPRELAGALKLRLGDASYHVRQLRDAGVLVLDYEQPVRGAIEHFYRVGEEWLDAVSALGFLASEHRALALADALKRGRR